MNYHLVEMMRRLFPHLPVWLMTTVLLVEGLLSSSLQVIGLSTTEEIFSMVALLIKQLLKPSPLTCEKITFPSLLAM